MSICSNINFSNFYQKEFVSKRPKLNDVYDSALCDLSISTVLTGSACLFAANSIVAISLIVYTVSVLSISIFSRMTISVLESNKYRKAADACRVFAPFNMALVWGATGNVIIHEMGHAAAARLMYSNAQPRITVHGLFTGSTSLIRGKVTAFGKLLSPLNALMFITAAGPLAAIAFATIGIILAQKLGQNFYLGKCVLFSSIFSIMHHVDYALSAFFADPMDFGHDFLMLWYGGIHPLVSVICIIAIPAIATLGYLYYKNSSC